MLFCNDLKLPMKKIFSKTFTFFEIMSVQCKKNHPG